MFSSLCPYWSSCFHQLAEFTEQRDLSRGRVLHGRVLKTGLAMSFNNLLTNSLINLYAKCGQLFEARLQFEETENRDTVSWNCLISGFIKQNSFFAALLLFRRMAAERVVPNPSTYAVVFSAAAYLPEYSMGKEAHCHAIRTGNFSNVIVGSSLLNMYSKLGLVSYARRVFDNMPERNLVSWTAMIYGYALQRCGPDALELFILMCKEDAVINEYVFTSVLSALALPEFVNNGRQVHSLVIRAGYPSFAAVQNALLTMYAKCGSLVDSTQMFMFSRDRDGITWSALITGLAQNDKSESALRLFSQMHSVTKYRPSEFTFVGTLNACSDLVALREGKQVHVYVIKLGYESQVYVTVALVDMYGKCGCTSDAEKGFEHLNSPDIVVWSSMIGACVHNGKNEQALSLYGGLEAAGLLPDESTMASVLRACSNLAALEQGKQVHAHTIKRGLASGLSTGSALANMYSKCGSLQDGNHIFRSMPHRDTISWNSMISGLSQNGNDSEALELFEEMKMEGTRPDSGTFVNLLCACSHMGMLERGSYYFKSMYEDYNIVPAVEHYACIVDLFGRAAMLNKAKDFIESVPINHGMYLWRILLGLCRNYRNSEIGAYAGEKLMDLGCQEASVYVLLASIYASRGRWDDVERVRKLMRQRCNQRTRLQLD